MQTPLQVTFEGSDPSNAARVLIEQEVARLETHHQNIIGCRVSVIAPTHKHRQGVGFNVHILINMPGHKNVNVDHASTGKVHEDAAGAIKVAFASARKLIDG